MMISKNNWIAQFIKFNIVGIINTIVDIIVFAILTRYFKIFYIAAQVISYSCGVLNSYFLNKSWTFSAQDKKVNYRLIKFVIVNLISLGAATLVLYYLEDYKILPVLYSKVIATIFSALVNFMGNKFWVFKIAK